MAKGDVPTFRVWKPTSGHERWRDDLRTEGFTGGRAMSVNKLKKEKNFYKIEFHGMEILEELKIKLVKYYSDLRETK
jgi:hypothetical protein